MDCNICLASGDHFRSLVQTHAKAHHLALQQKDEIKENRKNHAGRGIMCVGKQLGQDGGNFSLCEINT